MSTKIAWCDETINPVVGCSKTGEGCENCYAENMARRLAAMGMGQYQSVISFGRWNGLTAFVESELQKPRKWKRPRSIFVSSMGDLFHNTVNINWQLSVLEMIKACPQHTFILLTKRPENMRLLITADVAAAGTVLANLILGVSAEDQQTADERIRILLQIPAAKRFVSIEPMLEEIDLYRGGWSFLSPLFPPPGNKGGWKHGLDGVIVGGESSNKSRNLDPLWVIKVRDQCAEAGVPFMFKQWSHENRNETDPVSRFPLLQDNRTHTALPWVVRP